MGRKRASNELDLPTRCQQRRGKFYYVLKGKWHPLGSDLNRALRLIDEFNAGRPKSMNGWWSATNSAPPRRCPVAEADLRGLLRNARKNAKSRNLACTLALDDMEAIAIRSRGYCELTRIPFDSAVAEEAATIKSRRKRLWAPSLDRIDAAKGYTPENVRLVCFAVNAALQEFGDATLIRIGLALAEAKRRDQAASRKACATPSPGAAPAESLG